MRTSVPVFVGVSVHVTTVLGPVAACSAEAFRYGTHNIIEVIDIIHL